MNNLNAKLNEIINIVEKTNTCDELMDIYMEPKTILMGKQVLSLLYLDVKVNVKDFLMIYIISKYYEDIIGDITLDKNKEIYDCVKNIILLTKKNNTDLEIYKSKIVSFLYNFKEWKNDSKELLIKELVHEHHNLSVDRLECKKNNEDEKEKVFIQCQTEVNELIEKINGAEYLQEIKSYTPIVIEKEKLEDQYKEVFSDSLKQDLKNNNELLKQVLNYCKNILLSLTSDNALKGQITKSYDNTLFDNIETTELIHRGNDMLDIIKLLHAPYYDMELEEYRKHFSKKNTNIEYLIEKLHKLTENIINDIKKIKTSK
jgi:hypothetical protein